MLSIDRPLLAVCMALAVAAVPVFFNSLQVAAEPLDPVGVAKPTQVWLGELAPASLPEIVITAKRSAEFVGPAQQTN